MRGLGDGVYRLLLYTFPASFRRRHGVRMLEQFRDQRRLTHGRPVAATTLWIQAVADAVRHGLAVRRDARRRPRFAGTRSTMIDDIRYAVRGWRREPAVTAIIVLILVVGIGANAIMFGVVDRLLLQPPSGVGDVEAARRIYFGTDAPPRRPGQRMAFPNNSFPVVTALRDQVTAFEAASVTSRADVTVGSGIDARPATVQLVNAAYFPILGLQPAAGRFFTPAEDAGEAAAPVVVVSDAFWRGALGGDRVAIGSELRVEGVRLTVIGVTPPAFAGLDDEPVDLWVPVGALAPTLHGDAWTSPTWFRFELVARLAPEATAAQTDAQASAAYRETVAGLPQFAQDPLAKAFAVPLERVNAPGGVLAEGKVGLWLLGVAAIVLIIAVTNVATLLLTRTLSRRREIAIRLALGVGRGRLIRQLLTESALLAGLAVALALGVTWAGGRIVQYVLLPGFVWGEGVVDARVLAVTFVVGVLTALAAGVAPAWQALSTDLTGSLRATSPAGGGLSGLLRTSLLVAQVALCALLLVGSGLFVRSLLAVRAHDVGIDLDRVIHARLPDRPGLPLEAVETQYREAMVRIGGIPGVERTTLALASAPMTASSGFSVMREGWTVEDVNGRSMPGFSVVDADFFATLGASVTRGRGLTGDDVRTQARVAVVNRSMAADYWPGSDPVGQCLLFGWGAECTRVVGIVEDILQYNRLDTAGSQVYVTPSHPTARRPEPRAILIRAVGDTRSLIPEIRRTIQSVSPDMPFVPVETMEAMLAPQLQPWRLGTTMFLVFGAMALLIAAVGLYSAMAHAVSQRRHEIGVRIALGASRGHIVVQTSRRGAATIAAGTALGLAFAAVASRWLTDLLYETSPRDPIVFATVAVVLAGAGVAALIAPARRSMAVDPLVVLKAE